MVYGRPRTAAEAARQAEEAAAALRTTPVPTPVERPTTDLDRVAAGVEGVTSELREEGREMLRRLTTVRAARDWQREIVGIAGGYARRRVGGELRYTDEAQRIGEIAAEGVRHMEAAVRLRRRGEEEQAAQEAARAQELLAHAEAKARSLEQILDRQRRLVATGGPTELMEAVENSFHDQGTDRARRAEVILGIVDDYLQNRDVLESEQGRETRTGMIGLAESLGEDARAERAFDDDAYRRAAEQRREFQGEIPRIEERMLPERGVPFQEFNDEMLVLSEVSDTVSERMRQDMDRLREENEAILRRLEDPELASEVTDEEIAELAGRNREFQSQALELALQEAEAPDELIATARSAGRIAGTERGGQILDLCHLYLTNRDVISMDINEDARGDLVQTATNLSTMEASAYTTEVRDGISEYIEGLSGDLERIREGNQDAVAERVQRLHSAEGALQQAIAAESEEGSEELSAAFGGLRDGLHDMRGRLEDPATASTVTEGDYNSALRSFTYLQGAYERLLRMPVETDEQRQRRDRAATVLANALEASVEDHDSEHAELQRFLFEEFVQSPDEEYRELAFSSSTGVAENPESIGEARARLATHTVEQADGLLGNITDPETAEGVRRFIPEAWHDHPEEADVEDLIRARQAVGAATIVVEEIQEESDEEVRNAALGFIARSLEAVRAGCSDVYITQVQLAREYISRPEEREEIESLSGRMHMRMQVTVMHALLSRREDRPETLEDAAQQTVGEGENATALVSAYRAETRGVLGDIGDGRSSRFAELGVEQDQREEFSGMLDEIHRRVGHSTDREEIRGIVREVAGEENFQTLIELYQEEFNLLHVGLQFSASRGATDGATYFSLANDLERMDGITTSLTREMLEAPREALESMRASIIRGEYISEEDRRRLGVLRAVVFGNSAEGRPDIDRRLRGISDRNHRGDVRTAFAAALSELSSDECNLQVAYMLMDTAEAVATSRSATDRGIMLDLIGQYQRGELSIGHFAARSSIMIRRTRALESMRTATGLTPAERRRAERNLRSYYDLALVAHRRGQRLHAETVVRIAAVYEEAVIARAAGGDTTAADSAIEWVFEQLGDTNTIDDIARTPARFSDFDHETARSGYRRARAAWRPDVSALPGELTRAVLGEPEEAEAAVERNRSLRSELISHSVRVRAEHANTRLDEMIGQPEEHYERARTRIAGLARREDARAERYLALAESARAPARAERFRTLAEQHSRRAEQLREQAGEIDRDWLVGSVASLRRQLAPIYERIEQLEQQAVQLEAEGDYAAARALRQRTSAMERAITSPIHGMETYDYSVRRIRTPWQEEGREQCRRGVNIMLALAAGNNVDERTGEVIEGPLSEQRRTLLMNIGGRDLSVGSRLVERQRALQRSRIRIRAGYVRDREHARVETSAPAEGSDPNQVASDATTRRLTGQPAVASNITLTYVDRDGNTRTRTAFDQEQILGEYDHAITAIDGWNFRGAARHAGRAGTLLQTGRDVLDVFSRSETLRLERIGRLGASEDGQVYVRTPDGREVLFSPNIAEHDSTFPIFETRTRDGYYMRYDPNQVHFRRDDHLDALFRLADGVVAGRVSTEAAARTLEQTSRTYREQYDMDTFWIEEGANTLQARDRRDRIAAMTRVPTVRELMAGGMGLGEARATVGRMRARAGQPGVRAVAEDMTRTLVGFETASGRAREARLAYRDPDSYARSRLEAAPLLMRAALRFLPAEVFADAVSSIEGEVTDANVLDYLLRNQPEELSRALETADARMMLAPPPELRAAVYDVRARAASSGATARTLRNDPVWSGTERVFTLGEQAFASHDQLTARLGAFRHAPSTTDLAAIRESGAALYSLGNALAVYIDDPEGFRAVREGRERITCAPITVEYGPESARTVARANLGRVEAVPAIIEQTGRYIESEAASVMRGTGLTDFDYVGRGNVFVARSAGGRPRPMSTWAPEERAYFRFMEATNRGTYAIFGVRPRTDRQRRALAATAVEEYEFERGIELDPSRRSRLEQEFYTRIPGVAPLEQSADQLAAARSVAGQTLADGDFLRQQGIEIVSFRYSRYSRVVGRAFAEGAGLLGYGIRYWLVGPQFLPPSMRRRATEYLLRYRERQVRELRETPRVGTEEMFGRAATHFSELGDLAVGSARGSMPTSTVYSELGEARRVTAERGELGVLASRGVVQASRIRTGDFIFRDLPVGLVATAINPFLGSGYWTMVAAGGAFEQGAQSYGLEYIGSSSQETAFWRAVGFDQDNAQFMVQAETWAGVILAASGTVMGALGEAEVLAVSAHRLIGGTMFVAGTIQGIPQAGRMIDWDRAARENPNAGLWSTITSGRLHLNREITLEEFALVGVGGIALGPLQEMALPHLFRRAGAPTHHSLTAADLAHMTNAQAMRHIQPSLARTIALRLVGAGNRDETPSLESEFARAHGRLGDREQEAYARLERGHYEETGQDLPLADGTEMIASFHGARSALARALGEDAVAGYRPTADDPIFQLAESGRRRREGGGSPTAEETAAIAFTESDITNQMLVTAEGRRLSRGRPMAEPTPSGTRLDEAARDYLEERAGSLARRRGARRPSDIDRQTAAEDAARLRLGADALLQERGDAMEALARALSTPESPVTPEEAAFRIARIGAEREAALPLVQDMDVGEAVSYATRADPSLSQTELNQITEAAETILSWVRGEESPPPAMVPQLESALHRIAAGEDPRVVITEIGEASVSRLRALRRARARQEILAEVRTDRMEGTSVLPDGTSVPSYEVEAAVNLIIGAERIRQGEDPRTIFPRDPGSREVAIALSEDEGFSTATSRAEGADRSAQLERALEFTSRLTDVRARRTRSISLRTVRSRARRLAIRAERARRIARALRERGRHEEATRVEDYAERLAATADALEMEIAERSERHAAVGSALTDELVGREAEARHLSGVDAEDARRVARRLADAFDDPVLEGRLGSVEREFLQTLRASDLSPEEIALVLARITTEDSHNTRLEASLTGRRETLEAQDPSFRESPQVFERAAAIAETYMIYLRLRARGTLTEEWLAQQHRVLGMTEEDFATLRGDFDDWSRLGPSDAAGRIMDFVLAEPERRARVRVDRGRIEAGMSAEARQVLDTMEGLLVRGDVTEDQATETIGAQLTGFLATYNIDVTQRDGRTAVGTISFAERFRNASEGERALLADEIHGAIERGESPEDAVRNAFRRMLARSSPEDGIELSAYHEVRMSGLSDVELQARLRDMDTFDRTLSGAVEVLGYDDTTVSARRRIPSEWEDARSESRRLETLREARERRDPAETRRQELEALGRIAEERGMDAEALARAYGEGGTEGKLAALEELGIGIVRLRHDLETRQGLSDEEVERRLDQQVRDLFDLVIRGDLEERLRSVEGFEDTGISEVSYLGGMRGTYRLRLRDGRNVFVKMENVDAAQLGTDLVRHRGGLSSDHHSFSYDSGLRARDGTPLMQEFGIVESLENLAHGRDTTITLADGREVRASDGAVITTPVRLPDGRLVEGCRVRSAVTMGTQFFRQPDGHTAAAQEFWRLAGTAEGRAQLGRAWMAYQELCRRAGLMDRYARNTTIVLLETPDGELVLTFQPIDTDYITGRVRPTATGAPDFTIFNRDFTAGTISFMQRMVTASQRARGEFARVFRTTPTGETAESTVPLLEGGALSFLTLYRDMFGEEGMRGARLPREPGVERDAREATESTVREHEGQPYGAGFDSSGSHPDNPRLGEPIPIGGRFRLVERGDGRHTMHADEVLRVLSELNQTHSDTEFIDAQRNGLERAAADEVLLIVDMIERGESVEEGALGVETARAIMADEEYAATASLDAAERTERRREIAIGHMRESEEFMVAPAEGVEEAVVPTTTLTAEEGATAVSVVARPGAKQRDAAVSAVTDAADAVVPRERPRAAPGTELDVERLRQRIDTVMDEARATDLASDESNRLVRLAGDLQALADFLESPADAEGRTYESYGFRGTEDGQVVFEGRAYDPINASDARLLERARELATTVRGNEEARETGTSADYDALLSRLGGRREEAHSRLQAMDGPELMREIMQTLEEERAPAETRDEAVTSDRPATTAREEVGEAGDALVEETTAVPGAVPVTADETVAGGRIESALMGLMLGEENIVPTTLFSEAVERINEAEPARRAEALKEQSEGLTRRYMDNAESLREMIESGRAEGDIEAIGVDAQRLLEARYNQQAPDEALAPHVQEVERRVSAGMDEIDAIMQVAREMHGGEPGGPRGRRRLRIVPAPESVAEAVEVLEEAPTAPGGPTARATPEELMRNARDIGILDSERTEEERHRALADFARRVVNGDEEALRIYGEDEESSRLAPEVRNAVEELVANDTFSAQAGGHDRFFDVYMRREGGDLAGTVYERIPAAMRPEAAAPDLRDHRTLANFARDLYRHESGAQRNDEVQTQFNNLPPEVQQAVRRLIGEPDATELTRGQEGFREAVDRGTFDDYLSDRRTGRPFIETSRGRILTELGPAEEVAEARAERIPAAMGGEAFTSLQPPPGTQPLISVPTQDGPVMIRPEPGPVAMAGRPTPPTPGVAVGHVAGVGGPEARGPAAPRGPRPAPRVRPTTVDEVWAEWGRWRTSGSDDTSELSTAARLYNRRMEEATASGRPVSEIENRRWAQEGLDTARFEEGARRHVGAPEPTPPLHVVEEAPVTIVEPPRQDTVSMTPDELVAEHVRRRSEEGAEAPPPILDLNSPDEQALLLLRGRWERGQRLPEGLPGEVIEEVNTAVRLRDRYNAWRSEPESTRGPLPAIEGMEQLHALAGGEETNLSVALQARDRLRRARAERPETVAPRPAEEVLGQRLEMLVNEYNNPSEAPTDQTARLVGQMHRIREQNPQVTEEQAAWMAMETERIRSEYEAYHSGTPEYRAANPLSREAQRYEQLMGFHESRRRPGEGVINPDEIALYALLDVRDADLLLREFNRYRERFAAGQAPGIPVGITGWDQMQRAVAGQREATPVHAMHALDQHMDALEGRGEPRRGRITPISPPEEVAPRPRPAPVEAPEAFAARRRAEAVGTLVEEYNNPTETPSAGLLHMQRILESNPGMPVEDAAGHASDVLRVLGQYERTLEHPTYGVQSSEHSMMLDILTQARQRRQPITVEEAAMQACGIETARPLPADLDVTADALTSRHMRYEGTATDAHLERRYHRFTHMSESGEQHIILVPEGLSGDEMLAYADRQITRRRARELEIEERDTPLVTAESEQSAISRYERAIAEHVDEAAQRTGEARAEYIRDNVPPEFQLAVHAVLSERGPTAEMWEGALRANDPDMLPESEESAFARAMERVDQLVEGGRSRREAIRIVAGEHDVHRRLLRDHAENLLESRTRMTRLGHILSDLAGRAPEGAERDAYIQSLPSEYRDSVEAILSAEDRTSQLVTETVRILYERDRAIAPDLEAGRNLIALLEGRQVREPTLADLLAADSLSRDPVYGGAVESGDRTAALAIAERYAQLAAEMERTRGESVEPTPIPPELVEGRARVLENRYNMDSGFRSQIDYKIDGIIQEREAAGQTVDRDQVRIEVLNEMARRDIELRVVRQAPREGAFSSIVSARGTRRIAVRDAEGNVTGFESRETVTIGRDTFEVRAGGYEHSVRLASHAEDVILGYISIDEVPVEVDGVPVRETVLRLVNDRTFRAATIGERPNREAQLRAALRPEGTERVPSLDRAGTAEEIELALTSVYLRHLELTGTADATGRRAGFVTEDPLLRMAIERLDAVFQEEGRLTDDTYEAVAQQIDDARTHGNMSREEALLPREEVFFHLLEAESRGSDEPRETIAYRILSDATDSANQIENLVESGTPISAMYPEQRLGVQMANISAEWNGRATPDGYDYTYAAMMRRMVSGNEQMFLTGLEIVRRIAPEGETMRYIERYASTITGYPEAVRAEAMDSLVNHLAEGMPLDQAIHQVNSELLGRV